MAYLEPPATTTTQGLITLAGDLGGTATSPTVVSVAHVTTGTLPAGNQAAQTLTGDVTGTTAANTVVTLTGSSGLVSTANSTALAFLDGSGNTAATGTIRLPNTGSIKIRNAANSADLNLLSMSGNALVFGDAGMNSPMTWTFGSTINFSNSAGNINLNSVGNFSIAAPTGLSMSANSISLSTTLVDFANAQANPVINQASASGASATGNTLTLQAQNETGTTSVGGNLVLTSGTGTSTSGSVFLKYGGTTGLQLGPAGVITIPELGGSGAGVVAVSNTGVLSWSASGGFTAGGDLSGTSISQQVIGIDGYSILPLQDGYLYWNGTSFSWDTISAGATTLAGDVTGPSGANTAVSFTGTAGVFAGANSTVMTLKDASGHSASTGVIRLPNAAFIESRNAANTADYQMMGLSSGNVMTFGDPTQGTILMQAGFNINITSNNSPVTLTANGGANIQFTAVGGQINLSTTGMHFANNVTNPIIVQDARTNDTTVSTFTLQAESAFSGAVTNKNGGHLILNGGLSAGVGTGVGGLIAINAGHSIKQLTVSSTYTVDNDAQTSAYCVFLTGNSFTTTLPSAAGPTVPSLGLSNQGRILIFMDSAGNAAAQPKTLSPVGGALIDGATSYVINTNYGAVTLVSDGTNWNVVSSSAVLGTNGATGFSPAISTIAISGGTTTLSAAQLKTPNLVFTGTLASSETIDFGGNVGTFWLDFSGLVFGVNAISLKNGSTTTVITTLVTAFKTLVTVVLNGANNLSAG